MRSRPTAAVILFCVVLAIAFGCSNPPTAPSSIAAAPVVGTASTVTAAASTDVNSGSRFGNRTPGVVYVTSQGLYYDTFVVKDPLPMHGQFQLIADGKTEFGPGQSGYLGGRWWEDTNEDGRQDPDDHFFLCPLLPPGRTTP